MKLPTKAERERMLETASIFELAAKEMPHGPERDRALKGAAKLREILAAVKRIEADRETVAAERLRSMN